MFKGKSEGRLERFIALGVKRPEGKGNHSLSCSAEAGKVEVYDYCDM
jgi:hypothetical protein